MEEMKPLEYFEYVKSKKHETTDIELINAYDSCLHLLNKYHITGQVEAAKKLIFQMETIEKERELVKMGINTFVYRDDIETYIDEISKNVVKIIDLEKYERDIPDEIVDVIAQTKNIFNKFYIVFTDYTGKMERQVKEERREKDPILFGTFQDQANRVILDRFYYLGDWVDEYCDLTLDKLVSESKAKTGKNIEMKISTPQDIQELKEQLNKLSPTSTPNRFIIKNEEKPKSFFDKVKSVFKR